MNDSKLLLKKLVGLLPDEDLRSEVLTVLHTYGEESHEQEVDRVRLAILKLSGTHPKIEDIHANTAAAKCDYRDVLCWAEYPRQAKFLSKPDGPEKERAIKADKDEYETWLRS